MVRAVSNVTGAAQSVSSTERPSTSRPVVSPGSDFPGRAPVSGPDLRSTFDLVNGAKEGSQDAWDALCLRSLKVLHRFAAGRLPMMARGMIETQDLVQEAAERGLRHLHTFEWRHDGAFTAYLRTILMNLIRDHARASSRRPMAAPLPDDQPDDGPSPVEIAIGKERCEQYELALQRLAPRDREAIILRLEQQASYEELAQQLDTPTPNAARVLVRRALVRLGRQLTRLECASTGGDREAPPHDAVTSKERGPRAASESSRRRRP
jgi:RNA polymerase sigma-70 factor, ECF subfamily